MKYWITQYTQLWKDPSMKVKICDLLRGTIVESLDETSGTLAKIRYIAAKTYEGWIYLPYLEELYYLSPEMVEIDNATASQQDLAQYIIWEDNVQHNLCGELCVCYVFNRPLQKLLAQWKALPTSAYNRIFDKGHSKPTSINDLQEMANVLTKNKSIPISEAFLDAKLKKILFTPGKIKRWLDLGYGIIVGVSIETRYGRLRNQGVRHWVSIVNVVPDGPENCIISVYNPASNRVETYTWYEFTCSVQTPSGVLFKETV